MPLVRNRVALATTDVRRDALDIIEEGLTAIDTSSVVRRQVHYDGTTLTIGGHAWDLSRYEHIHLIGFGKASCAAAAELEGMLDGRITEGIALGTESRVCRAIDLCEATHPLPSQRNVELSERLVKECESVGPKDLVLVIVSGGGSAMLCWPASECEQGARLYAAANRAGLSVAELNTVRKHLSKLKGGGLATLLAPATVVGLIFSDVPGAHADMVASGPTYPDTSTVDDARAVIERHGLGTYDLIETPKDTSLFSHVTNIVLVSNQTALDAMAHKAQELGYRPVMAGDDLTDDTATVIDRLIAAAEHGTAVLAGGEPRFAVPPGAAAGGRNQHTALTAVPMLRSGQVFASVASDGMDNGPHGGALVDSETATRAQRAHSDIAGHLSRSDETPLLEKTGDILDIGPTGANVSDLLLLLTEK